jgi:single-stranded DNA-binding protein
MVEEKETSYGRVINFGLATNLEWRTKKGERRERTEWHKCALWSNPGFEIVKGDHLFIEGRLTYYEVEIPNLEFPLKIAQVKVKNVVLLAHPDEVEARTTPPQQQARQTEGKKILEKMKKGRGKGKKDVHFLPPQKDLEF